MKARLKVRLKPGSHRDELIGMRDGVLQVRVTAPPVGGRANQALCRLIAKHLRVAASRVTVARGEKSREKLIRVDGLEQGKLDAALVDL